MHHTTDSVEADEYDEEMKFCGEVEGIFVSIPLELKIERERL